MRNRYHWQTKTITRDFIYCPQWTGTALAGVKFTYRDYQKALAFSRSVARLMIHGLCDDDPSKVRRLADTMADDLASYNVAVMRAITPPVWGSNGDAILNWDGTREQVYSGHCKPVKIWRFTDYLRKQADKIECLRGTV